MKHFLSTNPKWYSLHSLSQSNRYIAEVPARGQNSSVYSLQRSNVHDNEVTFINVKDLRYGKK